MGDFAQALSGAVVKVGGAGSFLGWKAQWRRSPAVYTPRGAIGTSAAANTSAALKIATKRFIRESLCWVRKYHKQVPMSRL